MTKREKLLLEALKSVVYTDGYGVVRTALYGDSEVPKVVYDALENSRKSAKTPKQQKDWSIKGYLGKVG